MEFLIFTKFYHFCLFKRYNYIKNFVFHISFHETQYCLLVQKNEENRNNKSHHDAQILFLLIMPIVSLPEDNTISVEQLFHTFSQIYSKNLFPTKKLFFPSYIYLYKAEFLLLFVDLFLIIHNLIQLLQCIESIYSIFY